MLQKLKQNWETTGVMSHKMHAPSAFLNKHSVFLSINPSWDELRMHFQLRLLTSGSNLRLEPQQAGARLLRDAWKANPPSEMEETPAAGQT